MRVEYVENCDASDIDGPILNIGSGFIISRAKSREDKYFPSFDLPKPTPEEFAAQEQTRPLGDEGPIFLDMNEALGGLPRTKKLWRQLYNAYRLSRNDNLDRALAILNDGPAGGDITLKQATLGFILRLLQPNGKSDLGGIMTTLRSAEQQNEAELVRLVGEFAPLWEDRMDQKMEIFDYFFRAYDEFNQVLLYVRRDIELPDDPYAPSTDFENTRMYYGDAFEVLASHLDFITAFNNIISGRPFDQLENISLAKYRQIDKGVRNRTLLKSGILAWPVDEYDNRLRNASHHRWLRLSPDRSELKYREGGSGDFQRLSYAEYLQRCCRITRQLMLLAAVEWIVLSD